MTVLDDLLAEVPDPDVAVRAPGRANLIGEHTDYNDGFVLPVAIDLETVLVGHRTEGVVRLRSAQQASVAEFDLRTGRGTETGWGRYVSAVIRQLLAAGLPLRGLDGALSSTVPPGAGLSSSAALEVSVALALLDRPVPPAEVARLCQRAENIGVGVATGIMDQLVSACGVQDAALLLDCRMITWDAVPLPGDVRVVLVDSAVPRSLDGSQYGQRRAACEQAAAALGVEALRDVDEPALTAGRDRMSDAVWRRARHVVTENARVLQAAVALQEGDVRRLGELFAASHRSMATDFEITTPEVDALVDLAVRTPGVLASRMTGGGFGGCTVSLVRAEQADEVAERVRSAYAERSGLPARAWVCSAVAGAATVPL